MKDQTEPRSKKSRKEWRIQFVRLEVATHSIFITSTTFKIAIKGIRNIKDTLDVLHTKRFLIIDGEGLGCADCILDLF